MPVWKVCFQPRWVQTLSEGTKRYLKLRFQVEKFMAIIGFYIGWPFSNLIFVGRCSIESIGIFGLGIGLLINQLTVPINNPAASSDVVITAGYPILKPPPRWYLFIFTPIWGNDLIWLAHIFQMSNENTLGSLGYIYIADYITQLCWDYSKPLQGFPINQPGIHMKRCFFFVVQMGWFNHQLASCFTRPKAWRCSVPRAEVCLWRQPLQGWFWWPF